jgi:DMSO/TMAO reductase YedYZ heme-binding membrane subunit
MTPLTDRQGRFSPLKATTLALALLPAAVIAYWFFTHQLGPLPVKAALRLVGDWTIRLLVVTLALKLRSYGGCLGLPHLPMRSPISRSTS